MMRLTKPEALLFDWDNTLVDTWPTIHEALNATLRYMEHPEWSLAKVRATVKKSMRDSFPEMFGERWQEAADHYQGSYRAIHLDSLRPLPGAEEMLKAIPPELFVGVVSNKRGPTLREELEHLGWKDYFDIAVGSDDAARDKPHPDPVIFALREFASEFGDEVWFVGDTVIDLECAKATGTTPVLYGDCEVVGTIYDGFPFAAHVRDHAALRQLILTHLS